MSASLKRKLKGDFSVPPPSGSSSAPKAIPKRLAPTGLGKIASPRSSGPSTPKSINDGTFAEEMQSFQTGIKDESGRVKEFASENDICPICKTDRYSKPNLRLLISSCYHKACETCIDRLFSISAQTCPAPGCNRVLRKTNFVHQTFEDLEVEREVGVRRRMGSIFNKTSEDFPTDKDHDDYLEMVEDLTFNLINKIDLPATEKRILDYQDENAALIAAKAALQASSRTSAIALEEAQRLERQALAKQAQEEEDERERQMEALKRQAFESIARGEDGKGFYKEMEKLRAGAEAPAAAAQRKKATRLGGAKDNVHHLPTSPSYSGPYVPLTFLYIPPVAERKARPDISAIPQVDAMGKVSLGGVEDARYNDVESVDRQLTIHSQLGRVRAGGFDLREVWERDLRMSLEGLLIPTLTTT